jgi:hypothetical protein
MTEQFGDALNSQFKFVSRRMWNQPIQGLGYWNVLSTTKSSEKHSYVASSGVAPQSRDVDLMNWQTPIQGFDNTYTPVVYRLGMAIERRLVETDQFNVVNKQMEDLNRSARLTLELYAALPFNTAFDANVEWVCADGMNLIDSARPMEAQGEGTWSNLETSGALTQARVGTMRLNFRKNTDEFGNPAPLLMKNIAIPPDLQDTTIVNLETADQPGSSLNSTNYLTRYNLSYKVWDYLTSTTAWFGFAPMDNLYELNWYWGASPKIDIRDVERGVDVFAKRLRMVFVSGADRPHSVRGNAGT